MLEVGKDWDNGINDQGLEKEEIKPIPDIFYLKLLCCPLLQHYTVNQSENLKHKQNFQIGITKTNI